LIATGRGEQRDLKNFLVFERGAASFPWRSQAQWIGQRIAAKHGLDLATAADRAAKVFRTDLYRHHLAGLGVDMPGASRKVEGSIRERTAVASASGRVILEADSFFDGTVFDPDAQ
jgi:NitT/TauT family transport system ATP-binding protein